MTKRGRPSRARQQILDAATTLFFQQGYQATGVSDIITEAGISKPTFYAHFDSKEDLCLEYLRFRQKGDMERFKVAIRTIKDPLERFLAPFDVLEQVQIEREYRGCPYYNMFSEVGQIMPLVAAEINHVSKVFDSLFRDLFREVVDSDPDRYAELSEDEVVGLAGLLFNGAIVLSSEQMSTAPIEMAREQLRSKVEYVRPAALAASR